MVEPVVFDAGGEHEPRVLRLIDRLGIPRRGAASAGVRWRLTTDGGALSLVDTALPGSKPLAVDFGSRRRRHRSLPIPRRSPMARALGRGTRTVVDATAGWGSDMFLMWLMGYDVVAVERSVIVGALVLDGLARMEEEEPGPVYPRVEIGDAAIFLQGCRADCIYVDPMFPPRPKSSPLVKRPLRVLRDLVGSDDDRARLFEAACRARCRRVVIKRPNYAEPWAVPDESFRGKMMSYDLYLRNR